MHRYLGQGDREFVDDDVHLGLPRPDRAATYRIVVGGQHRYEIAAGGRKVDHRVRAAAARQHFGMALMDGDRKAAVIVELPDVPHCVPSIVLLDNPLEIVQRRRTGRQYLAGGGVLLDRIAHDLDGKGGVGG